MKVVRTANNVIFSLQWTAIAGMKFCLCSKEFATSMACCIENAYKAFLGVEQKREALVLKI